LNNSHVRYGILYPLYAIVIGLLAAAIGNKYFQLENVFTYLAGTPSFNQHVLFAVGAAIFAFMYPNIIADCIKGEHEKIKSLVVKKIFLSDEHRRKFDHHLYKIGLFVNSLKYIRYIYACVVVAVVALSFIHLPFFVMCLYIMTCFLYFSAFCSVTYVLLYSRALRHR
jgi:hypothetical protein